jgi:hypothetical protein
MKYFIIITSIYLFKIFIILNVLKSKLLMIVIIKNYTSKLNI